MYQWTSRCRSSKDAAVAFVESLHPVSSLVATRSSVPIAASSVLPISHLVEDVL